MSVEKRQFLFTNTILAGFVWGFLSIGLELSLLRSASLAVSLACFLGISAVLGK